MEILPENLPAYLVGTTYSPNHNCIFLIFYNEETNKLYMWKDNSNHKPYFLSNLSPIELEKISALKRNPKVLRFEQIQKWDALNEKDITVTKIVVDDPTIIGGKPSTSLREIVASSFEGGKAFEGRIPYGESYIYDKQLEMGMPYIMKYGFLEEYFDEKTERRVKEIQEKIKNDDPRWIRFFEYSVPYFLRASIDIEVLGKTTQVPNPNKAEYPIVSASLVGSDNQRIVFMLRRNGVAVGQEIVDAEIRYFDREDVMLYELLDEMKKYPMIISFNGDNFDFPYLHNRAIRLGIPREKSPIMVRRRGVKIKNQLHLDLYRFFFNKSIRIYAFQGKYKNIALDEIAVALLGKGKIKSDKPMEEWTYTEMAQYNLRDSELTIELTTFTDDLTIKLIMALMRLSGMGMEELTRFQISQWIKGIMYYEHRKRNWLIPNPDDLLEKGKISTEAVIKGKKYKGAIVVEPIAGVHFNVAVMDFASLYPSVMKVKNLGYATINCNHEECKHNKVPETSHWVCTKNKAMEGEIIGLMRDLRIYHYKNLGKKESFYKVMEQTMKVIMNGGYGVFGDNTFSLYCPPVAESTTAYGRHAIGETIKKSQELGIKVLYGDTDSVFLQNPTKEQIKALHDWSEKDLDLDLDVDKEYRYVCLSSRKKNYLGVTPDGTIDVKGMTGKKKHVPDIIKGAFDVSKKYLSKAETLQEIDGCKRALKKVIQEIYFRIKRREFEIEEMAFHMTLGKSLKGYEKSTPQHVRAAIMLKEKEGIELKKGDLISFVKCTKFKYYSDENNEWIDVSVKPLQMARKEDVDIDKYHEMLKSTFEQLLDALNIDYDSVMGIMKLDAFN